MNKRTFPRLYHVLTATAITTGFLAASVIPDNQGVVTLSKPANAQTACDTTIRTVSFTGKTSGSQTQQPNVTTNVRSNTTTSATVVTTIPPNTNVTFSAWAYGSPVNDLWTGNADYRWFRVTYGGKTGWVASGVINGNPPAPAPLTPTCSSQSYYPNISTPINQYFSNISGWPTKTLQEKWDRIGGDSTQYGQYSSFPSPAEWTKPMPSEVLAVYQNLATDILGSPRTVTTGYAYDKGYHDALGSDNRILGAHSGIDISTSPNGQVRSATKGRVVRVENHMPNGWWIAIDELNSKGERTGRRWWYGHLEGASVRVNQEVNPLTRIATTGNGTAPRHHLHLTVVNSYGSPQASPNGWNEIANGKGGTYTQNVSNVLSRTVSPLHAYWKYRNGIKE